MTREEDSPRKLPAAPRRALAEPEADVKLSAVRMYPSPKDDARRTRKAKKYPGRADSTALRPENQPSDADVEALIAEFDLTTRFTSFANGVALIKGGTVTPPEADLLRQLVRDIAWACKERDLDPSPVLLELRSPVIFPRLIGKGIGLRDREIRAAVAKAGGRVYDEGTFAKSVHKADVRLAKRTYPRLFAFVPALFIPDDAEAAGVVGRLAHSTAARILLGGALVATVAVLVFELGVRRERRLRESHGATLASAPANAKRPTSADAPATRAASASTGATTPTTTDAALFEPLRIEGGRAAAAPAGPAELWFNLSGKRLFSRTYLRVLWGSPRMTIAADGTGSFVPDDAEDTLPLSHVTCRSAMRGAHFVALCEPPPAPAVTGPRTLLVGVLRAMPPPSTCSEAVLANVLGESPTQSDTFLEPIMQVYAASPGQSVSKTQDATVLVIDAVGIANDVCAGRTQPPCERTFASTGGSATVRVLAPYLGERVLVKPEDVACPPR